MNFFEQQAHAQKQTRRLLWLFGGAVVAVSVLACLALTSLVWIFQHPITSYDRAGLMTPLVTMIATYGGALFHPFRFLHQIADPRLCAWTILATIILVAAGCLYKKQQLAAGGSAVAKLLGGKKIERDTADLDKKKLCDVVEEMAIAAGLPVPEIYLLERERGINTFAAGHTRDDVAIGVTFGAFKLLSRDELQGVIAHEFSHVLNGDTRLNMRLMILAHGLFWPTLLGRVLTYGSPEALESTDSLFDKETKQRILPTVPVGLVFLFIGSISSPFARLIKSMICREREWLADAAAVQFTRNPAGIEGALKKIGGLYRGGQLDSPNAEVASHLYFANSNQDPLFNFLSTHPPTAQRILAIDPAFDGRFAHVDARAVQNAINARDDAFDRQYEESVRREREQMKSGKLFE
ncbi:MAG TPA: M48 family metalloprotease [Verrucomicrobiae bacterium]|jgi:Zn-dependent protease with chaperone function